jgi:erythromycin esterase-like protein
MLVARASVSVAVFFSICLATGAQVVTERLRPYPLASDLTRSLEETAAQSDILILGECHGTQEVPALAASLLTPLGNLGYNTLAIEVPADQQEPLRAWATGKTGTVPSFFARPSSDGRGNLQLLALVRMALSAPFRWNLICYDETEADQQEQLDALNRHAKQAVLEKTRSTSQAELPDFIITLSRQRDAAMASNLARARRPLAPPGKCLVICGNLHARTANHSPSGNPIRALWPSFAAVLQRDHAAWRVDSVNVLFHGGGYFNGGQVNVIKDSSSEKAMLRPVHEGDWMYELHLPHATPATFLTPPADTPPPHTKR